MLLALFMWIWFTGVVLRLYSLILRASFVFSLMSCELREWETDIVVEEEEEEEEEVVTVVSVCSAVAVDELVLITSSGSW